MNRFNPLKNVRLAWQLLLVPLLFIGVVASILVIMYYGTNNVIDKQLIDLSGRQRMLNQRHVKEILLASQGYAADYRATRKLFSTSLEALSKGGPAVISSASGEKIVLPAPTMPALIEKLGENRNLFEQLVRQADSYLALAKDPNASGREDALKQLLQLNKKLHAAANDVVKLYTSYAQQKAYMATVIDLVIGTAGAAFGLLLSLLVIRNLLGGIGHTRVVEE